ncbi:MAG: diaminopimelate epimerase [Oscillospiraceae bacterium]|nr:diaminopimelate epimerase [Oscillospiraceae bacterium]
MKFCKMNGAGNDFLILNNIEEKIPAHDFPALARTLCHRHLSIGADGFMVIEKAQGNADFKMLFFNSDGSMGEMCGNGARCICRYGYENGLSGETQTIETTAGIVTGERISKRLYRIRLNNPSVMDLHRSVEVNGTLYDCAYVELGDPGIPHAVVSHPGLDLRQLFDLGSALRRHSAFPKGANVNFYRITEQDQLEITTFERGVEDFTYACGTGTGSTVAALTLMGKVSGKNIRARMAGGELTVTLSMVEDTVSDIYLTGPTNIVAKGEVTDEELCLTNTSLC